MNHSIFSEGVQPLPEGVHGSSEGVLANIRGCGAPLKPPVNPPLRRAPKIVVLSDILAPIFGRGAIPAPKGLGPQKTPKMLGYWSSLTTSSLSRNQD